MKKLIVFILALMALLTSSLSLAYWKGEINISPVSVVKEVNLEIGEWDFMGHIPGENILPIGVISGRPLKENQGNRVGNVYFFDDVFYLFNNDMNGQIHLDKPNSNPLKPYSIDYVPGTKYKVGDIVVKDDVVYKALKDNASNHDPVEDKWMMLGSINDLQWDESSYEAGTVVFFNGSIYIANRDVTEVNQPGSSFGWDIQNELGFDYFSAYQSNGWYGYNQVVVSYQAENDDLRLYKLIAPSNIVDGNVIVPGSNNEVWMPYE